MLLLGERSFSVESLVMDVLCLLISRAGDLVCRDEIIDHVWVLSPGGDESLTRAIAILRKIFAQDGAHGDYIKTVWKRGYVLVAKVEAAGAAASRRPMSPSAVTPVAPMHVATPSYSVAVLPFANASTTRRDGFLADGITRDLTMLLSRVPRLRVAAYSSALLVREGEQPLPEMAERLGTRYFVSGSLARHGDNFQLRVALMDAGDDAQIWAQRIDAPLVDFYKVQDKIVLDVSTSLTSALQLSHAASISGRRPFQLSAYELVQRAEALRLHYNRKTALEIVDLLNRALAIDSGDATVHAALAVQHTQNVVSSFVANANETFSLARRHVDQALAIAPSDPEALAAAGIAATMMGNARAAVQHLERAVEIDPNNPHSLAVLGWQHCWLHGTRDGIDMIETAEARAPHHPRFAVWAHYRGHCEIRLGNVAAAVGAYRDGQDRNPDYSLNLVTLIAALELAGRTSEADEACCELTRVSPGYTVANLARLARRMACWFGETPSEGAFVAAFQAAWSRAKAGAAPLH